MNDFNKEMKLLARKRKMIEEEHRLLTKKKKLDKLKRKLMSRTDFDLNRPPHSNIRKSKKGAELIKNDTDFTNDDHPVLQKRQFQIFAPVDNVDKMNPIAKSRITQAIRLYVMELKDKFTNPPFNISIDNQLIKKINEILYTKILVSLVDKEIPSASALVKKIQEEYPEYDTVEFIGECIASCENDDKSEPSKVVVEESIPVVNLLSNRIDELFNKIKEQFKDMEDNICMNRKNPEYKCDEEVLQKLPQCLSHNKERLLSLLFNGEERKEHNIGEVYAVRITVTNQENLPNDITTYLRQFNLVSTKRLNQRVMIAIVRGYDNFLKLIERPVKLYNNIRLTCLPRYDAIPEYIDAPETQRVSPSQISDDGTGDEINNSLNKLVSQHEDNVESVGNPNSDIVDQPAKTSNDPITSSNQINKDDEAEHVKDSIENINQTDVDKDTIDTNNQSVEEEMNA